MDRLAVDGRDFLYTAFPGLCKAEPRLVAPFRPSLRMAFSGIIDEYIQAGRGLATDEQLLFRLVDHAVMDRRVIEAQRTSKVDLFGRYGTRFRSAFGVRGGIEPCEIIDVMKVDEIDHAECAAPAGELGLLELLEAVQPR